MFVCLTELKVAVNVNVILFLLEFNSDYIIQSSWNCSFFHYSEDQISAAPAAGGESQIIF